MCWKGVTAKPSEKKAAMQAIQTWNKKQTVEEARISMSDLTSAAKRRKSDEGNYEGGMRFSGREDHIRKQLGVYNAQ